MQKLWALECNIGALGENMGIQMPQVHPKHTKVHPLCTQKAHVCYYSTKCTDGTLGKLKCAQKVQNVPQKTLGAKISLMGVQKETKSNLMDYQ